MCTTCGCGSDKVMIDAGAGASPYRRVEDAHGDGWHRHGDGPWHQHAAGPLGAVHAHDVPPARRIAIERDLLAVNDAAAARIRERLVRERVLALNLVSSPGSGKTTLLVRTIRELLPRVPIAVIEGDQQTSRDAERIRATGAPAVQVNTGKGCHLDAHMIERALAQLPMPAGGLLLIENVGNLVCPAAFDLGEVHKVVMLSVTEGEDKPLKYPDMFAASDLCLMTKIDLMPYVDFDGDRATENARCIRPGMDVLRVSAISGAGMKGWLAWIERELARALSSESVAMAAAP